MINDVHYLTLYSNMYKPGFNPTHLRGVFVTGVPDRFRLRSFDGELVFTNSHRALSKCSSWLTFIQERSRSIRLWDH